MVADSSAADATDSVSAISVACVGVHSLPVLLTGGAICEACLQRCARLAPRPAHTQTKQTHRHTLPTAATLCRPVDRVVGAYEFAVDVAARGVLHQGPPGKLGRRKSDWVGTLEVRWAPACGGRTMGSRV